MGSPAPKPHLSFLLEASPFGSSLHRVDRVGARLGLLYLLRNVGPAPSLCILLVLILLCRLSPLPDR